MNGVELSQSGNVAVVTLHRGKVNAINEALVQELARLLDELEAAESVRAAVLTGHGSFFSFGFDIPELFPYSREAFTRFLDGFTRLYAKLFLFPRPVVAAINGHAIAGGCMLATACDRRIMASGKGRISLNEITFGASVLAGSVAILKACVGPRNAETILYSGAMYSAEEASDLGLVDRVVRPEELPEVATEEALELARGGDAAFTSIKGLLRGPIAREMAFREAESIREFVDIWYSPATRERVEKIEIRK